MSPELITLIGSISVSLIIAVIGPTVLFRLQAKERVKERAEDHDREDEIAARVAQVATDFTTASASTDAALIGIKNVADQTHTLVNSNMDEEKRRRLEGAIREQAGLRELVELRRSLSQEPTVETLTAIENVEKTIAELEAEIAERAKRLIVADANAAEGGV